MDSPLASPEDTLLAIRQELGELSAPAFREFQHALVLLHPHLTPLGLVAWAQEGLAMAKLSGRAGDAAQIYFQVSPTVLRLLAREEAFLRWGRLGGELARESFGVAVAYFRSSAEVLPHLPGDRLESWRDLGRRLYHAADGSLPLASRFFNLSAPLLRLLPWEELDHFIILLRELSQRSPQLATILLDVAVGALEAIEAKARQPFLTLLIDLAEGSWGTALARAQLDSGYPYYLTRLEPEPLRGSGLLSAGVGEPPPPQELVRPLAEAAQQLGTVEKGVQSRLVRLAARLARLSPHAAAEFLKHSSQLLSRLSPSALDLWCQEGETILRGSEEAGLAFFRLQSPAAAASLGKASSGVELAQVREVLRLYCQALSGKRLQVLSTEELTKKAIGWSQADKPTTEGSAIYAPPRYQDFSSPEANFQGYKVTVAHQAGHLEFGTFDFSLEREASRFPNLRALLSGGQALMASGATPKPRQTIADFERFFDLFAQRRLAEDLFTVAEDTRIDARLRREYPGLRGPYQRVQASSLEQREPIWSHPLREALVELLLRFSAGHETRFSVPAPLLRPLLTAAGLLGVVAGPETTVEDAAEATLRLYSLLRPIPNLELESLPPQEWQAIDLTQATYPLEAEDLGEALKAFRAANGEGADDEDYPFGETAPQRPYRSPEELGFRGELKPELTQTLLRLRLEEELRDEALGTHLPHLAEALKHLFEKSAEISMPSHLTANPATLPARFVRNLLGEVGQAQQETVSAAQGKRQRRGRQRRRRAVEAPEAVPYLYDEWDFRARQYKAHWCRLWQRVGEEGSEGFFEETLKNYPGLVADVKRQFELLRAERLRKVKRLFHGEEVDLDAAIESIVEKRAGQSPNEKVYWRRNKTERDVAVALLLDMSVSTDERIDPFSAAVDPQTGDPAPWRGKRIIDLEKESLVLLIKALELIGDRYAIYGFSGQGKDHVEFIVIKGAEEQLSDQVKRRIDKIAPIHGTRMGTAIRHAIAKLEEQEAKTKVLILLSDGRPQDRDYGRDPQQIQHLVRELMGPLALMRLDAMRIEEIADRREKEYAVHDTRMALLEARQKHIIPFCISVDKTGHDYLRTMCGDIGYEVVSDIHSLPKRLTSLYRRLTT